MIRINLLPPEKRQEKWQIKRIALGLCLLTFSICMLWYGGGMFMLWQDDSQWNDLTAKHQLLTPSEIKMQAAQQKMQSINVKNNVLVNTLTKERKSWYSIITYLSSVLPPHVWFNEVSAVDKDSIKVIGVAINYPDVANFLNKLEHDEMFADPVLVKADYDPLLAATKFEISVRIKGL